MKSMENAEKSIESEQDNAKTLALREERITNGQCPTCGQQLYTFKKTGMCWCIVKIKLRKIPLSIPNLVERGQCCQCELNQSSKTFQTIETSSCWSDSGIPGAFFGNLLDPIASYETSTEIGRGSFCTPRETNNGDFRTGSPASLPQVNSSTSNTAITAVYEGGYNNKGEKHGEGVMTWSNGDVFKGSFHYDKRRGHGALEFNQDGGEYVGEWLDDKMHGCGTRRYPNGDIYVGSFDEGKREGDGRFYFSNGDMHNGKWKNNQMHGPGHYYFSSGTRFEGMFLFNKRNGKGKTQGASGSVDIFQYINDERVGQGVRFDEKRTRAWRLIQRADGAVRQNGSAPLERQRITMPEAVSLVYEIENASNSHMEDLLASRGLKATFLNNN